MIKILLITGAILLSFFFIVTSFASGFVRGIKLMSTRNIKKSPLEERLLKQFFKQNENVDPFFYSLYIKDAMDKNTGALKAKHQEQVKNKKHSIITGDWINKRSKKVWKVEKIVDEINGQSEVIVTRKNITKTIAKNSFIKNWKKI